MVRSEPPARRRVSLHAAVPGMTDRYLQDSGHPDQLRERIGVHLSHDLTAMYLRSGLADAEPCRGLLGEQPADYERNHVPFARGKGRVALAKLGQICLRQTPPATLVERRIDRAHQVGVPE